MEYSTYLSALLPGVYGVLYLPFLHSPSSRWEYSTYLSALLPRVDRVLDLQFLKLALIVREVKEDLLDNIIVITFKYKD
jgi:hypothetical protein